MLAPDLRARGRSPRRLPDEGLAHRDRGILHRRASSPALLTEIPGSSDVVERGFVTYSNEAKTGAARRVGRT